MSWTIGWGATGRDVVEGLVWTQTQADARLSSDLERAEINVRAVTTRTLSDVSLGALIDFDYNTGGAATLHPSCCSGSMQATTSARPRLSSLGIMLGRSRLKGCSSGG